MLLKCRPTLLALTGEGKRPVIEVQRTKEKSASLNAIGQDLSQIKTSLMCLIYMAYHIISKYLILSTKLLQSRRQKSLFSNKDRSTASLCHYLAAQVLCCFETFIWCKIKTFQVTQQPPKLKEKISRYLESFEL